MSDIPPSQGQSTDSGTAPSPAEQAQAMLGGITEPTQDPSPQTPPAPVQSGQQTPPEPVLSDFAQGVLKDIPEADRDTVARYLPKWDAGVTRRFQEVQSPWAPFNEYLESGMTHQDLLTAAQLYAMLEADPEKAIGILQQATGVQVAPGPGQQQPTLGNPELGDEQTLRLPPELQQQLDNINSFMQAQALQAQQQQRLVQEQEQDRQLEQYLQLLHQEKGDFDEGYVLSRMAAGVDGATAVDQFNAMIAARVPAPQAPSAPPVLSGGSAPAGQKPITEASDKERKDLVAQMLQAANQSG